jgi:hypothetical protein
MGRNPGPFWDEASTIADVFNFAQTRKSQEARKVAALQRGSEESQTALY